MRILNERWDGDATHDAGNVFELKCDKCSGEGEIRALTHAEAVTIREGNIPPVKGCKY
jgi:hypothetical protein